MIITREKIYRINEDADAARLSRIVEKCNAHVARGERCPVCLGHTEGEGATEWLTVDVGDMSNFVTDGEWVYADLRIDDAFEEAVKRHRGKSVELWSDDLIYPLSLLAHNRPALELEPVKFSRDGITEHQTYQTQEEDIDMDATAIKNLVSEILQSSDLAAAIRTLTDQVGQLSLQVQSHGEQAEQLKWLFDETEDETPAAEGETTPTVEAEEHPELPVTEGKGEEKPDVKKSAMESGIAAACKVCGHKWDIDVTALKEGGKRLEEGSAGPDAMTALQCPNCLKGAVEKECFALPSGTNTFVPSTKTKKYEELELEAETYRVDAENQKKLATDYAGRVEEVSQERVAAQAALATMEAKCRMLNRKNELIVLAGRYEFDPEKEMALVEPMTDEQFETHKKMVVVRYSMPPVHVPAVSVGELPRPADDTEVVIPQAEVLKVAKYCLDKVKAGDKTYEGHLGWKKAAKEMGVKVS